MTHKRYAEVPMAIDNSNELKSSKKVAASGQHQKVSPRCGLRGEVKIIMGKPLLPRTRPASTYNFANPILNQSGQGISVSITGPQTKGKFL